MPFFDYFAMGPLANWLALHSGPGAAPLDAASKAYTGINRALNLAADGADGSNRAIEVSWEGMTSDRAQASLRKHTAWVRDQAALAAKVSSLAAKGAEAHGQALALMPSLADIVAAIKARKAAYAAAAVGSTTQLGLLTLGLVAAAEANYRRVQGQAAGAMEVYEVRAIETVMGLAALEIVPPPQLITGGGGVGDPSSPYVPLDHSTPLNDLIHNGPDSGPMTTDTGTGPTDGPQPVGDSTTPGSDPTDPISDPQPGSQADRAASDIERALSSGDLPADSGVGDLGPDALGQDGFYGTSPYSTTLAGMSGGIGSLVGLGMLSGGLGSMSGASTGFRMPANWAPGTGTAFGAGTGNPSAAPASRALPRKGVSAPTAQMRRRRKEEDKDKPAKVFVPGEQLEVPVLERPPAIGVIEYGDDDIPEDTTSDAVLVGVLDRFDAEAETVDSETPR